MNRSNVSPLKTLMVAVIVLSMFPSCATKMSIEQAKQVSVSMADVPTFVPPPRRIDDILEILNQPGQFDKSITEKFRARADAAAPENADGKFFHDRGFAAAELGRPLQALEDYREALRRMERAEIHNPNLMRHLATRERGLGNFNRAVKLLEESLSFSEHPSTYGRLVETYIQMGDLGKAAQTLKQGSLFCATSPNRRNARFVLQCDIETAAMEAFLLEAQAKYAEAEKPFRQHLTLLQTVKDEHPGQLINARLQLADNLLKQERLIEAEIEARQALKDSLGHAGKDSLMTAGITAKIADILRAQGRLTEADKLASTAVRILESAGIPDDSNKMGGARMLLGSIMATKGDYAGAMEQFTLATEGVNENQYLYKKRFLGNPNYILALVMTGQPEKAIKITTRSYETAKQKFGEKHYITAQRLALRGMAHHRMKNNKDAFYDLSTATEILIGYQTEKGDYSKTMRLRIVLDDYINLLGEIHNTPLEKELGMDAASTAFRIAEASRSRTVQGAVVASSARAAETNPELNDLMRKEQDALKQIDVLETAIIDLLAAPSEQQRPEMIKDLRTKIESLLRAHDSLLDEIKKRSPRYAEIVNPPPSTPEFVQKYLHPDESLISIHTSEDHSYVWAIPYRGNVTFASVPFGKKEIMGIVKNLRKSLDPKPQTFGDIPEFDVALAHELYARLIKPAEEGWKDARDLLFVVDAPLNLLPLSVLPTAPVKLDARKGELFAFYRQVPWLIRKASITMLPSVSSLIPLRTYAAGEKTRKSFIGFGDPVFRPDQLARLKTEMPVDGRSHGTNIKVRGIRLTAKGDLDDGKIVSTHLENLNRLPDTAEEIETIARVLGADPERDVFLREKSSKRVVKSMNLSDRRIIAFATHALVPGDLDGLDQPALALSAPGITGDQEDGLLTMAEIMKLKLDADWVILSACNTGAADGAGAEAISGLGRAFFYAGTRAILASMYPVETTSAKKLVTQLFELQKKDRTLTRARALQESMLELINSPGLIDENSGKIVASYAHPLFWAPFVLVGDGSGSMK
ncbi:MAG: CHAT domain-containing protein [Deltaproteobacteria bacterium]|nr:CHAT domain-containing protein [Deltaproteobacteria bacterium]